MLGELGLLVLHHTHEKHGSIVVEEVGDALHAHRSIEPSAPLQVAQQLGDLPDQVAIASGQVTVRPSGGNSR